MELSRGEGGEDVHEAHERPKQVCTIKIVYGRKSRFRRRHELRSSNKNEGHGGVGMSGPDEGKGAAQRAPYTFRRQPGLSSSLILLCGFSELQEEKAATERRHRSAGSGTISGQDSS